MKTTLKTDISVARICDGFVYNQLEGKGLFGLGGNRRGIFEYILGGLQEPRLLDVRVFDEATKRSVYAKQTTAAEAKNESNCPLCAIGPAANKSKIWKLTEMDADHVSAWSKGGRSSAENCQMLCTTHNRAKGNR